MNTDPALPADDQPSGPEPAPHIPVAEPEPALSATHSAPDAAFSNSGDASFTSDAASDRSSASASDPHTGASAEGHFDGVEPSASEPTSEPESGPPPGDSPGPAAPKEWHFFRFVGEGGEFFGVYVVGLVLSLLTLTVYYPWFRAAVLRYVYEKTEFMGSRWTFIGSGSEMFVGYIKFLLLIGVAYGVSAAGGLWTESGAPGLGMLFALISFLILALLMPLAVHGALRYRLSRSVWRGIHGGYSGRFGDLMGALLGGLLLSYLTIGIYYPWFQADLGRYLIGHLRFGSLRARFRGQGSEIAGLYLRYWASVAILGAAALFSLASFSIAAQSQGEGSAARYISVMFNVVLLFTFAGLAAWSWVLLRARTLNWFAQRTELTNEADGRSYRLEGRFTPAKVFQLTLVNLVLLAVSLGIAFPWVIARNLDFFYSNIAIDPSFDPDTLVQTQAPEADATGEGLLDFFDIGLS